MQKLGVVISTFNRKSYLKGILKQLLSQERLANLQLFPVIVVDGSNDGTYEMLATEFPQIDVVKGNGNWWWTKCINEGIKFLFENHHPEYILLLNDDSIIQSDYIKNVMQATRVAGENAIIGSISVTDTLPFKVSFSGVKKNQLVHIKKTKLLQKF